jgi:ABC-type transporter Mla MlaB component
VSQGNARTSATGAGRLCLEDTSSLDSSGLNLLLDLQKAGVAIADIHADIRESLERFGLIDEAK